MNVLRIRATRYQLIGLLLFSLVSDSMGQGLRSVNPNLKRKGLADFERLIKRYRYVNPDSAVYFAQQGITFARMTKDSSGVGKMLVQLGMIDDNQGKFEASEKKYQYALRQFKKTGSKKDVATVTIRLGVVALRNGNYDKAIGQFLQALKLAESSRDTFGLMEANYNISWAHLDQDHYELALQYLRIADGFNQRLPFSNLSLNIYNHFGVIYRQTGDLPKARQYLTKGIQLSNIPEYQGLNITLINNLASVYAKEGLKDKAIALQEKTLLRSREIDNYLRELQSLYGLARTYGNDNPTKAIFYLRQAILLARRKKAHKQEMRYLKEITGLYKTQGNYQEALLTKEREHALADSFFYKDMSRHIESLKADYELSKSKARVNALNYLNHKNRLELEKSALVRNVSFTGFIAILIILGLLYNQYRVKQQKNKEIEGKNESLQLLLEDKEWLLKEIHHRVKNNLQIITSLLHSQSVYLKDQAALSAIRESQNRVHAMALIHQKLYQSDQLAAIPMNEYIEEIVDYLINTFDYGDLVQAQLTVYPINLDVIQAVLIGLIINEAVTNSLKYAFPSGRFPSTQRGTIRIHFQTVDIDHYLLQISDDGIGLPPDFNPGRSRTLGMSLIRGLSRQLGGDLQIRNEGGLQLSLRFAEDKMGRHQSRATNLAEST